MDLKGIISISGMSGLFKVVAQSKNGFIVESLLDKRRIPAYSSYKISTIEEISVYSTGDDVPLAEVLKKIMTKEKGAAAEIKGDDAQIRKYFESAFPEFDKERVHTSDIKKIIGWYNILQKNDLLKDKEADKKAGEETDKAAKALAAGKEDAVKKTKKASVAKVGKTSAGKVKVAGVRKSGTA
ncbi:MAG: DUF5606 domain-containing protein [Bacteroidetes bacterium]|nr:DUF5606 domain-containing protein [Bacteroidota bacterium]